MKAKLRGLRKQDALLEDGKFCGVAAAMIGSAVVGAAASSSAASKGAKATAAANQANIDAAKIDPRQEAIIYGDGTNGGLLGQYQELGKTPQNAGINTFGRERDQYVGYQGSQDLGTIRNTALQQMQGGTLTPTMKPLSQNQIDLAPAFEKFINGNAGANPYLTKALQGGIDQSQQAFTRMKDDTTRNLQETILPAIGQGAVIAGGYGGSRHGIAEGRAIGDTQRELARATENFGNNNTSAVVGAQAGEFSKGQDRSLSALMGLNGQQQQAAHADQLAALQTNTLNMADRQNGVSNLGGLVNGAVGAAKDQDAYALGQASQVNGLLAPYLAKQGNVPQIQPVYSNSGGAALGGAMAGMSLYNQFRQPQQSPPPAAGGGFASLYPASGY